MCLRAQTILRDDPLLEGHKGHLEYRWQQYRTAKQAIIDAEGSLADFALVRRLLCPPSHNPHPHEPFPGTHTGLSVAHQFPATS